MRKSTAEKWLSLELDGELSSRRAARLAAYKARHPELLGMQEQWAGYGAQFEHLSPPRGQTPEAAWFGVRRALRRDSRAQPATPFFGWSMRLAVASMAVLAVTAAVLWFRIPPETGAVALGPPEVDWVETDLPDALSMVYQDQETGWTVIWVMSDEVTDAKVDS